MNRTGMIDFRLKEKPGSIEIRNMMITNEEIQYICSKADCPGIFKINLSNLQQSPNAITYQGMFHMSRIKWERLTQLCLTRNSISDKGCKYLTKTDMPSLKQAFLSSNNIGDAGILHISKATWQNILILSISSRWGQRRDWMGVDGYPYLMRGNWRNLQRLCMDRKDLNLVQVRTVLVAQFLLNAFDIYNDQVGLRLRSAEIQSNLKAKYPQAQLYN